MSLIEKLENLSNTIEEYINTDLDESNTETFCVEPFIELLEFRRNPVDMQKQYPADLRGGNRAVDYALKKDGAPIMIIECKPLGAGDLDAWIGQLRDYFAAVREARFGVLTDGRLYRFYTDLDSLNLMDSDPFLEIDLFDIQPLLVAELEQFTKSRFNVNQVLAAAGGLKYSKAIHQLLMKQLGSPDESFVRYVASAIDFPIDTLERQQITEIFQRVLKEFKKEVNDPLLPPLLPGPVPPIGPDPSESWTGKKISGAFTFEGETYQVKDWKDFYVKFFEILSEDNTLQFRDVLELKPSSFSENPDSFPPSAQPMDIKKIGETDIYVFASISNADKQRIIGDVVKHFGRNMPVPHTD